MSVIVLGLVEGVSTKLLSWIKYVLTSLSILGCHLNSSQGIVSACRAMGGGLSRFVANIRVSFIFCIPNISRVHLFRVI